MSNTIQKILVLLLGGFMKKLLLLSIMLCIGLLSLNAQDFYDPDTVNEIRLYFTQSNWNQILNNLYAAGEERLIGNAIINGVAYDSVGVRYKGNSSYSANRAKNPFNIKLNHVISGQRIGPYGTLKLANGFSDPSFVRETLAYEIARKYMPASRANYADIYVNDTLIGVYTNVQSVDDYFGEEHLGTGDLARIKGIRDQMGTWTIWGYINNNPSSYLPYYELDSGPDWDSFINFLNVFNNNTTQMESVLNVDRHLWNIAFDWLFVNLDAPINFGHNFYVFEDSAYRFNTILWDLNMCFGGFTNLIPSGAHLNLTTMQNLDPLTHSTHASYPILNKVLSNPMYKRMYIAHMRTMIEENISNGWLASRGAELQSIVGPHVQADPNYFYTYANFQSNLNNSVTGGGSGGPGGQQTTVGITQLMTGRATYLLNHTAFQGVVPEISNLSYSPLEVEPNSTVTFTLNTTNASTAYLGWRQGLNTPFVKVQMFDDGAHNDGAAGDGIFGVSIPVSYGKLEYYAYAENTSQGRFLPARAEFEFFEIPIATNTGELVINEIMAKNASFPDPDGEMDDWVEIYNPNDYPVNIAGMYMVDNHFANGISAWTQIPDTHPELTTIPPYGYLIVWFDEDLDQGPLHINDKLGGSADAVYLIDSDGSTIIDSFSWVESDGLNVNDVSIGRFPDGAGSWQLFGAGQDYPCTPGAANQGASNLPPVIGNYTISPYPINPNLPVQISVKVSDADNDISDVRFIYGQGAEEPVNLEMTLANGLFTCEVGPYPDGSIISGVFQASDAQSNIVEKNIFLTIGYEFPPLFINEVMPSNSSTIMDEAGQYEDWIEIYNPNAESVNLAGCYLTDDHFGGTNWEMTQIPSDFPAQTSVPAGGFLLAWFDEHLSQGAMHVNTKLGTTEDAVYLIAPDGETILDYISWNAETSLGPDLSYGRYLDGTENWIVFGLDGDLPVSPGIHNGPVSIEDPSTPETIASFRIYPNPMRDKLTLQLTNSKAPSKVRIYNLKGQLVKELDLQSKAVWNGTDKSGKRLGSGIYLIRTEVDNKPITMKICLIQ